VYAPALTSPGREFMSILTSCLDAIQGERLLRDGSDCVVLAPHVLIVE